MGADTAMAGSGAPGARGFRRLWVRTPVGPLDYARRLWIRLFVCATFVLLYAPIVTLMIFSFNDSRRNVVWRGFTTKYYVKAWNNDSLIEAFTNSITIAVLSTVISTVIGAMVALMLWRFRFRGKAVYEGFMALPIVVPEICMGVAMLVFFARVGWPSGGFTHGRARQFPSDAAESLSTNWSLWCDATEIYSDAGGTFYGTPQAPNGTCP